MDNHFNSYFSFYIALTQFDSHSSKGWATLFIITEDSPLHFLLIEFFCPVPFFKDISNLFWHFSKE